MHWTFSRPCRSRSWPTILCRRRSDRRRTTPRILLSQSHEGTVMSRRHALWWALVAMTSLQCAGFAHAEVSSHLLGRWIVVQLGGKPAYMPYKLRLFQHASVFPDDRQYGIADFELEAYG